MTRAVPAPEHPESGSPRSDAELLLARLRERGWTIGFAESLTGGMLTSAMVSVAGASASVRGGVIAYATPVKHSLLGVDAALLEAEGPVHPDVARQMAEGVRAALTVSGAPADVGVSTTGVAGPGPADGHPAGTVHIGVATPLGTRVTSLSLEGDRSAIRAEAVQRALRAASAAVASLRR